jgi:hypothetical protein
MNRDNSLYIGSSGNRKLKLDESPESAISLAISVFAECLATMAL